MGWFLYNLVEIPDWPWEEVSVASTYSSTSFDPAPTFFFLAAQDSPCVGQLVGHHPAKQRVAGLISVRAHAWVAGSTRSMFFSHINVSHPLSSPLQIHTLPLRRWTKLHARIPADQLLGFGCGSPGRDASTAIFILFWFLRRWLYSTKCK